MSLKVNVRAVGDVTILDLNGRIVPGEESGTFRDAIRQLLDEGKKMILLNFADVKSVDSSGLGQLVSSHVTATNQGASLKLLNVQKRMHEVLQITRLYTIFQTFADEKAAVESFSG